MVLLPTVLGLIGACSAFIALVARFRFDPFYTWLVQVHPRTRQLQAARTLLADGGRIRIADHQDELETIHQMACKKYDNISEQYTPVEFWWVHQGFCIRYAEERKDVQPRTPGIQEEMLKHIDWQMSRALAKVAAAATGVAIVGFLGLLSVSLS